MPRRLDRLDRADESLSDATRRDQIDEAIQILLQPGDNRAEQVQLLFSREYDERWREEVLGLKIPGRLDYAETEPSEADEFPWRDPMYYFDPHIHMVSRTTDDYETLAKMGCVAVSEPAFWAGYDRGSVEGFRDYFEQLTAFEPKRAGWYGIQHYTWLCINAKEAENVTLSREVIEMIPRIPRSTRRVGNWRDRAQQEYQKRSDGLLGTCRASG